MVETATHKKNTLQFKSFPGFASYLLKNKLSDFIKEQLRLMTEVNFPVLKYYDLSMYTEEQLVSLSMPTYTQFLNAAIENKLNEHLDEVIKKWETDQLPNISKDQLVVDDVTLATYTRKKALLIFIPSYTSDINLIIELIKEIDEYILQVSSRSLHTLFSIHNKKLQEVNDSLKEHEKQLLEAQEIAGFGSFEWNLKGGISKYTPQVFKIFEMEESSDLPSFMEYVHPSDREKLGNAINNALTGEKNYECEYRFRKNGVEKVLWSKGVVSFEDNVPSIMRGTIMDITERHYILKRLERNEELYKQAQKLTHIGNWTWDLETGKINFSDELCRIYGLEEDTVITTEQFFSMVHPSDKEMTNEKLHHSITTLEPHTVDFKIIHTDGTVRTIRRNTEVLWDEKGIPYKLLGTGQDITKEVLLTKELEDLNLSLEQKNIALERSNKELTSFSYVASHDLQEPLRKIKAFSNLILDKEKNLSPEGQECFNRIMISAGRMQQLIEDLLSFSRTQLYEKVIKPVDLNAVISEIKTLHSEALTENRLHIYTEELPIINGVQFQIQQLFENIISNSIKYSQPGKPVEIKITSKLTKADALPFYNSNSSGKYYKISLSDNGIGFDQKYAEKIFEIFQRLHGKNEYSGTGIGLSICKRIIENHRGFITAQSAINEGATFEIYLPN